MKPETKEWLKQAQKDIEAAKYNLEGRHINVAAFLSQQAAEKALKAFQIEKTSTFDKTHDLYFLAKKLNIPNNLKEYCEELSEYYLQTRYPDIEGKLTYEDINKTLTKSREIIKWIKENL